jgi:hypothetical protein
MMKSVASGRRILRTAFIASALVAVGAFPASAAANLTGEQLVSIGGNTITTSVTCTPTTSGSFTFEASGIAIGPVPGTFTETGTATFGPEVGLFAGARALETFEAGFEIQGSDGTTVTGVKRMTGDPLSETNPNNYAYCDPDRGGIFSHHYEFAASVTYEARIQPPSGDPICDRGTGQVSGNDAHSTPESGHGDVHNFGETFVSTSSGPCGPQTTDDCMKDAWQTFPGFKNQGDCVAFVATGGKNEPGQNIP